MPQDEDIGTFLAKVAQAVITIFDLAVSHLQTTENRSTFSAVTAKDYEPLVDAKNYPGDYVCVILLFEDIQWFIWLE